MMRRHSAFSALLQHAYLGCIRLSVHGSSNAGDKFSVNMFADADKCMLPYHNVIMVDEHGKNPQIMTKRQAQSIGGHVQLRNGQPWCFVLNNGSQ